MKRQSDVRVTVDHVKDRYAAVFLAWGSAAKRYPGGITEFAHQAGRNPVVMMHRLNRNALDHVPTLEDLLLSLETMQPPGLLNALALLAGRVTVPLPQAPRAPREVVQSFLELVRRAGEATASASEALADERLDPDERARLVPLMDALLQSAVEFEAVVRGG